MIREMWSTFKNRFEYSSWWLFVERHVYAKRNVEVIADFEHRMALVLCQATRGMSKPYYTAEAMCAEIADLQSWHYDEGYKDAQEEIAPFQKRVLNWMMACFSNEICRDRTERNHRFLEEALELVQSLGCRRSEAHMLVEYVFNRPVGEPHQEVGGVAVTLAALCSANDLALMDAAETELARINAPNVMMKIRAKQATKPKHSPLPERV